MFQIKGFEPIANEKSTILVLGTIPSELSIEKGQYYANPRNQFWKIIEEILGVDSELLYCSRVEILLAKGIALWDVLKSCERGGSVDKDIKNPVGNDLETFLTKHKQINRIGFNGQKSRKLAKKLQINFLAKALVVLPSSSPANTSPLVKKIGKWKSFLS